MPDPTTTTSKTAPGSAAADLLRDRAGRIGARWTSSGGRGKLAHTAIAEVQVIDMSSKRSRLDAITHLSKSLSHV